MNAHIYIPQNELREAINYIWYHEAPAVKLKAYNIPFLHQELIINFGAHLSITNQQQQRFGYPRAGGITGVHSQPTVTRAQGHYAALGIMLKPFGLYRLSGFSAAKLNGQPLTMQTVWGDAALSLLTELEATPAAVEKIRTLEKFLLRMARPHHIPEEIYALQQQPSLHKGHIKSNISDTLISSKKYIQTSGTVLGMAPKKYTQLVLVNAAIAQIAAAPEIPLTAVAYDNGFYDQAHFIRVFKAFAGMTPSAYRMAVREKRVQPTFPNTIFIK
jgi:AraC-like DNA-binding protein